MRKTTCIWCGDQIESKKFKKHFKKCREEHLKNNIHQSSSENKNIKIYEHSWLIKNENK